MKIYEILNERVSSILYHATGFDSAENILTEDKLMSREGGISFTRSLTGKYHIGYRLIGVIFEFDGDLLNRVYKGGPVGTEDWDFDDNISYHGRDNEQLEDRIYTKDGIKPVTKYIKSAILYCPYEFVGEYDESGFEQKYAEVVKYIPSVVKLLTKKKIPFRYVATAKEAYNKDINNKEGFLKAVAEVDESVAISLGFKGSKKGLKGGKKFRVYMTLVKQLPKGEIDNYSGENFSYTTKNFSIIASSIEAAQKEAQQMVDKLNADLSDEVKKAKSEEWFLDDVEEQY